MKRDWDERQRQELGKIGEISFLVMFFVCGSSILVQLALGRSGIRAVAGETAALLSGGAVYLSLSIRKGLWKKTGERPGVLKNLAGSLACSGVFTVFYWLALRARSENAQAVSKATGLFFVGIALLCFFVLTFLGWRAEKVRKTKEKEYLDPEELEEEEELVKIFTASGSLEAKRAVLELEKEGIFCVRQGEPGGFMELYGGNSRAGEDIYVTRENQEKGRETLAAIGLFQEEKRGKRP